MKLYETSVRKPISTILVFVGVMVFGLFSLNKLDVDLYPEVDFPAIMVFTTYPGANAADIERNITRVLEDNLNTVSNIKKISSKSSDNISLITLEFEWGSDLTEAANDIRDVIGRVTGFLPEEANDPSVWKLNSSLMPVMMLSVSADESYNALQKMLDEQLVNRLNRIDGVGAVSLAGAPKREIQVNVDPQKLQAYKLTVEQIGAVIAQENVNIPAGTIDVGNNTFNLKTDNEFFSSDNLYDIIVANYNGSDVYLRDVAHIKDTVEKETLDERVNGRKAVKVVIQKQSGANSVKIVEEINSLIPVIQSNLPSDIEINTIFDTSEFIVNSINSLRTTILFAFLFVMLVVLFFLQRWRATFIILITIPVSLIAAFIYLYLTGSTLNIVSLSSLSIGIGLVVDDAIVVLENISKHIERGASPKEAAIHGTNEVWLAVIATTLTIVAVFLPLTMIEGMAGILLKELGWIVSIVVVVSTVASITLTPMLSSIMLKQRNDNEKHKKEGAISKSITRGLDKLDLLYARLVKWALCHKMFVVLSSVFIFISSFALFAKIPVDFMPASDNGIVAMKVELDQNVNVSYTSKVARSIDSVIYAKYPEVELLSTSSGEASGENLFTAMMSAGSHVINYNMKFVPMDQRERSIFLISDLIREDLAKIPEINRFVVTPGGNMGGGMMGSTTLDLKIFGYDFEVTNAIAKDLKEKVERLDGTRDVTISREEMRPEYNVNLDRTKLSNHGLNTATVSAFIRNRIKGYTATKYREDGDEYDVVVRLDEKFRSSVEDIENILVYNPRGVAVRVGDLGSVSEEFSPPAIDRENKQRIVSVKASLGAGVALGSVVEGMHEILNDYVVPENVIIEIGGTVEDQKDSFADMGTFALLILVLVYIVMATQFESFIYPFVIMFTILLAFPGISIALFLTNTSLSLMALIGSIMLIGIVVKNGIVMVDFMNLLRERGRSVSHSVIEAGRSRLRPILMTSVSTILGMLPLALGVGEGSEIWQPMGIAIIGGLTFSTFMTLFIIPIIYFVFGRNGVKRKRRKLRRAYRKKLAQQGA